MTEFQKRCLAAIETMPNEQGSLLQIAAKVGSSQIAVFSALESLRQQGQANYIRSSGDQWGVQIWFASSR